MEKSLELSPLQSKHVKEFNEPISTFPVSSQNTNKMFELYDCPLCEEFLIEKTFFKNHLAQLHDIQESCDCEECLKCMLKEVFCSTTFSCSSCEDII